MDKKPRIGIFIDTFFPRIDGPTVGIDAISKIMQRDADITVFCPAPLNIPFDDSIYSYKVIRCRSKKIPFIKDVGYDWPSPNRQFRKLLNETELDLVHIRSPFAVGKAGLRYAKKHKIPTVITLHSQYKQDFKKATRSRFLAWLATKVIMRTYKKCDEVWSVNDATKQVLREYGIKNEIITMENGTSMLPVQNESDAIAKVNNNYNISPLQKTLLYVGRISKLKGIYFIADVLKELKDKGQDFKMIFVGDGPDFVRLKKYVHNLGLDDFIVFTGMLRDRDELAKIYTRADLFMFPSFYDTDGVVKKEAACQGTPIICIENSIVASSVIDRHNAFVGPNNIQGFAAKIQDILGNTDELIKVGTQAHKDLYITWEQTAKKTLERYHHLIQSRSNISRV